MTQTDIEMDLIETGAKALADARLRLAKEILRAEAKLLAVREDFERPLKEAATAVLTQQAELLSLVDRAPALFKRPQSIEFHGVRVGWRKGKGRLELPETETLIKRIVDQLTQSQRKTVLKVKTTVLKGGLAKLSGEILKKLGINVTAAGSEAFVSFPKSDAEKHVDWWLKPVAASADEEE